MGCDMANDGRNARRNLGIVPQEIALYSDLTATENRVLELKMHPPAGQFSDTDFGPCPLAYTVRTRFVNVIGPPPGCAMFITRPRSA
jgi:hypothetical protein